MSQDQADSAGSPDWTEDAPRDALPKKTRRSDVQFLARPPRGISAAVALRVLFGGWLQQLGWVFCGFGMIFAWIFVGNAEIAWSLRAGTLGETEAKVTEHFDAGASVNDVSVYGTRYVFELAGRSIEGTSYATGQHLEAGDLAQVEYSIADPERSRIRDMRSAMFGPEVLFVLIFPGVGVLLVIFSLRGRLRELRLLRSGQVAYGRLVGKSPTNMTINKQPVFELRFEFKAQDGRTGTASARSHVPGELEDEVEEALLYDPNDLARAVMLDAVPGRPQVERSGALSVGWSRSIAVLMLPALTLGGHGYWAYLKFFA